MILSMDENYILIELDKLYIRTSIHVKVATALGLKHCMVVDLPSWKEACALNAKWVRKYGP